MDEGNHIIQLAVGGGVTVAGTSWAVKYFLTRLMKRIEDIESTLNGKPGDAKSQGLVGLVQSNSDRDEDTKKEIKALSDKIDNFANNHYKDLLKRIQDLENKK